jgi:hypothetical protein
MFDNVTLATHKPWHLGRLLGGLSGALRGYGRSGGLLGVMGSSRGPLWVMGCGVLRLRCLQWVGSGVMGPPGSRVAVSYPWHHGMGPTVDTKSV